MAAKKVKHLTQCIKVYITPADEDAIRRSAMQLELSISEYVRKCSLGLEQPLQTRQSISGSDNRGIYVSI